MGEEYAGGGDVEGALVVLGSANADIYVEINRLPKCGETIAAHSGFTLAGGKGANQAACASRLSFPTFFIAQVGDDGHATLLRDALSDCGVRLDYVNTVTGPSGHAIVMLQSQGQNSIIIVGGANTAWKWDENDGFLSKEAQQRIRKAGALLLQREIPDPVNIQAAKIARSANVPVIMDAGGFDSEIPDELLKNITLLSPNETELARLSNMPTASLVEVVDAAKKCLTMGVNEVLVKLGEKGCVLVKKGEVIHQPAVMCEEDSVVDTTGAGDTFTAAYAVALLEGKNLTDALAFAAAAASVCIRSKGAIPSMPTRNSVMKLLQQHRQLTENKHD